MRNAHQDRLSWAVSHLLPALDAFLQYDGPDQAGRRSAWQPELDEPLPQTGAGAERVLQILADTIIPHGLRTGAPSFSGWVTTTPTEVPAAASLAAAVSAPQRWWISPGNFLEALSLRWLASLLSLPGAYQGVFVSGGSVANLIGLGAARQYAGERLGVDAAANGNLGIPQPRVYAGPNAHHAIHRALAVLGLGRRSLRIVEGDPTGRVDPGALERALLADVRSGATPVAIVGSAGDVNTGSIDPLEQLANIARERQVWLHVDGAYGAFGVLDDRVRPLYAGFNGMDSLAVDPHKWLAAPVGCGAAFVRDASLLGRTFTMEPADYLSGSPPGQLDTDTAFEELGYEFHDFGVEQSAPSRGLVVWALLKEIGLDGVRSRVTNHLNCARRVADRVRSSPELELLAEPVLSICCFRCRPAGIKDEAELNAFNEAVLRRVWSRQRCLPSSTKVGGRFAIRPCFINPRTSVADAELLVDEVLAAAREEMASPTNPC